MEALNEVLLGCLDAEVEALQQRKAEYDGERRLSDGSDSCWSCSGSDSGNEAELVVSSEPLTIEGATVVPQWRLHREESWRKWYRVPCSQCLGGRSRERWARCTQEGWHQRG